jgi:hypothetical protein
MLQIATGMYFDGGPMHETVHRAAFYTNAAALRADPIEVPFGRLLFASGIAPVTALTLEVIDRLPVNGPDGEPSFMVATGGTELLDYAATVFAFWANVTCSRHLSLVERLVPRSVENSPSRGPSSILRRTFDPQVIILPEHFEGLREFCSDLLALRRDHFEAAMRAMRKVVDACTLVSEDPGLAYTLFVSSIDALTQLATGPEEFLDWDRYDPPKRAVLEPALADLDAESAERMRLAILRADQLSLSRRFKRFTNDHIDQSFYRADAEGAVRPIRPSDLPHALDVAYRLRSRNVHELRDLEPELWVVGDRADTLRWEGRWVLSLEGLNRLCRHVIRSFISRSPTDFDREFNYRDHLPGIVKMQLAPEYWVGRSANFRSKEAPAHLEGFIELLCPIVLAEEGALRADLADVLERIERLLPSENAVSARRPMVAIYVLWHQVMTSELHRPSAAQTIERFGSDLDGPSMEGFAVRMLLGGEVEWTTEQIEDLVRARRAELERGKGQPLPPRFDTALLVWSSGLLWSDGRQTDAMLRVAEAVESLPGNAELLELEAAMQGGSPLDADLRRFALGGSDWIVRTDAGVPVSD